mgnify:CR=1 FL=1
MSPVRLSSCGATAMGGAMRRRHRIGLCLVFRRPARMQAVVALLVGDHAAADAERRLVQTPRRGHVPRRALAGLES